MGSFELFRVPLFQRWKPVSKLGCFFLKSQHHVPVSNVLGTNKRILERKLCQHADEVTMFFSIQQGKQTCNFSGNACKNTLNRQKSFNGGNPTADELVEILKLNPAEDVLESLKRVLFPDNIANDKTNNTNENKYDSSGILNSGQTTKIPKPLEESLQFLIESIEKEMRCLSLLRAQKSQLMCYHHSSEHERRSEIRYLLIAAIFGAFAGAIHPIFFIGSFVGIYRAARCRKAETNRQVQVQGLKKLIAREKIIKKSITSLLNEIQHEVRKEQHHFTRLLIEGKSL